MRRAVFLVRALLLVALIAGLGLAPAATAAQGLTVHAGHRTTVHQASAHEGIHAVRSTRPAAASQHRRTSRSWPGPDAGAAPVASGGRGNGRKGAPPLAARPTSLQPTHPARRLQTRAPPA